MYNYLLSIDFAILDFIAHLRHPASDRIMVFITSLGDRGLLWILLTCLLLCFPKTRRWGMTAALALIINFALVNLTLKPLIGRIRPYDIKQGIELIISTPSDFSFPSGHTSAAFAFAVALLLQSKKIGIASLALAVLIAFSRLYLYVHFPSDVLGGALIGSVCAVLAYFAVMRSRRF